MKDLWEIADNKGTIFSGSEEEMREQLRAIEEGKCVLGSEVEGDIKLLQVHYVTRQYTISRLKKGF